MTETAIPTTGDRSLADLKDLDPYPFFADVQARGRVVKDEAIDAWLVFGYADGDYVMRNEDLFAGPWATMNMSEIFGTRTLFGLGGDPHRVLYTEILNFFSPRVVRQYRGEFIQPIVADRVARFAASGRAELAADLADEMPVRVIGAMLGMDWQEETFARRCWRLTDAFLAMTADFFVPGKAGASIEAAVTEVAELDGMIRPAIRSAGPDSYVARLWRVGGSMYEDWNEHDVLENCRFLFIAGMHTTSELICNATWLALQNPELPERIAAAGAERERMLGRFVEEALRMYPPLQFRFRIATQDLELAGTPIRRGDRVVVSAAAGNRDPQRFECPAQPLLETRPGHLSFNTGPRFCGGTRLARAEAYDALDAILGLPDLRWDTDAAPAVFAGLNQRAYRPLNVAFTPPA
jgi:cytochrome P450